MISSLGTVVRPLTEMLPRTTNALTRNISSNIIRSASPALMTRVSPPSSGLVKQLYAYNGRSAVTSGQLNKTGFQGQPASSALASSYSTKSGGNGPTVESFFLEHTPLSPSEKKMLEEHFGSETFKALSEFRHRQGLCHYDTTSRLIELAGNKPAAFRAALASSLGKSDVYDHFVGAGLNTFTPAIEMAKGNTRDYSMSELLEKGVPSDCLAVIISARTGVLDPNSEQARAATKLFEALHEPMFANHAIAVLKVQDGQVYCLDGDPFRKGDALFKVDVQTFQERVSPRLIAGITAVPKAGDKAE